MAEIKLFIATTLDGFIARENGSLDWLQGSSEEAPDVENVDGTPHDGGYGKFIATIDVIIIGKKTYEEILGFGVDWPYADCKTYIATSDVNYKTKTENTFVLNDISNDAIEKIKQESNKDIWMMGGGQLITEFLNLNAVDEMTLTIVSIILGKGIRLFPNAPLESQFELENTETFGKGMVNLTYRKKQIL